MEPLSLIISLIAQPLVLKVLGETVGVFDIVTAAIAGVFLFALYTVFQIPGYYKHGSIKGLVFMYIPVAGFLVTLLLLSKMPAIGNSIISVVESSPILLCAMVDTGAFVVLLLGAMNQIMFLPGGFAHAYTSGKTSDANVGGSATVTVSGGTVTGCVYGGDKANVTGNISVEITGGTVNNVYGGVAENSHTANVDGNTSVSIKSGTVAGSTYAFNGYGEAALPVSDKKQVTSDKQEKWVFLANFKGLRL